MKLNYCVIAFVDTMEHGRVGDEFDCTLDRGLAVVMKCSLPEPGLDRDLIALPF